MPRLASTNPSYRRHRASGQAIVTVSGHDHYLGPYGTKTSKAEYDRVIGEWLANGRRLPGAASDLAVSEVVAAFIRHADDYYRRADGTPTGESTMYRTAARPLIKLYGHTAAAVFGPLALQAVRDRMIADGWCRTHVNAQTRRVRSIFRWAVAREMVPAGVLHGLVAVAGLREGRTPGVKESEPVQPVAPAAVDATLPHLSPIVRAMVELQRLAGCRPGEVVSMRPANVDTSDDVWVYRPRQHKTRHHGRVRAICIGPVAQKILAPYLERDTEAFCFSPAEATAARLAELHAHRRTPASCGNTVGSNRRKRPLKSPGENYTRLRYARAIATACDKAFPAPAPLARVARETHEQFDRRLTVNQKSELREWRSAHRWAPNQLRHLRGTEVRAKFGIEAAQHTLGHAAIRTTEIYAERNFEVARATAAAIG